MHTLGTSCDAARAAADMTGMLIAEVNARMPRTSGNTVVLPRAVHTYVETDRPLPEHARHASGPVEARIGELIADKVFGAGANDSRKFEDLFVATKYTVKADKVVIMECLGLFAQFLCSQPEKNRS
jgi:hypothetical protein